MSYARSTRSIKESTAQQQGKSNGMHTQERQRRDIMEESDGLQACAAESRKTSASHQGRTSRAARASEATKRGRNDREESDELHAQPSQYREVMKELDGVHAQQQKQ